MKMTKDIIPYILTAFSVILGGCRSDCNEPDPGMGEALELSIVSAEAIVAEAGTTRATEKEYARITLFEAGDVVGLSVTDAKGTLLADNVPYRFDGSKWDVDTDQVPENRRVYFEKSMYSYMVYYPYKKEADGCTSIQEIKDKCFPHQTDQTEESAYLLSDPLAWSISGNGIRKLEVTLRHLRNSFMIDPKVRWILSNNDTITYQPLREALETFVIRNCDGDSLRVFHAPDSTYRYILPDNYDGSLTWRYAYRYYKFIGTCHVDSARIGIRYVQDEMKDMGSYDMTKAMELDCFCKDQSDEGYILPWDAVALLRKDNRRCIGVVHHIGQHMRDSVDYAATPVGSPRCKGYVLALTDSHTDVQGGWEWDHLISVKYRENVGTHGRALGDQLNRDWNGYEDCVAIKAYADRRNLQLKEFPAEYSCDEYGNSAWQQGLKAPRNTTGWFLPSDGILHHYLAYDIEKLRTSDRGAVIRKRFEYIRLHTADHDPYKPYIKELSTTIPYSSSTEMISRGDNMGRSIFGLFLSNLSVEGEWLWKYKECYVRPVLVF